MATMSEQKFQELLRSGAKLRNPKTTSGMWQAEVIGYETLDGLSLTPYLVSVQETAWTNDFFAKIISNDQDKYLRKDRRFGFILIDIVKYSRLDQDLQVAIISRFQSLIIDGILNDTFRIGDVVDGLVPTGDGCFIVIKEFGIPSCLDIAEFLFTELAHYNEEGVAVSPIQTRFAVHVGVADYILDLAGKWNYLGDGMNDTARVAALIPSEDTRCIYISEEAEKHIIKSDNMEFGDKMHEKDKHGKDHVFRRLIRPGDTLPKED